MKDPGRNIGLPKDEKPAKIPVAFTEANFEVGEEFEDLDGNRMRIDQVQKTKQMALLKGTKGQFWVSFTGIEKMLQMESLKRR